MAGKTEFQDQDSGQSRYSNARSFNSGRGEFRSADQNIPVAKHLSNKPDSKMDVPGAKNSRDRYEDADRYKGGRDFSNPEWGNKGQDDLGGKIFSGNGGQQNYSGSSQPSSQQEDYHDDNFTRSDANSAGDPGRERGSGGRLKGNGNESKKRSGNSGKDPHPVSNNAS